MVDPSTTPPQAAGLRKKCDNCGANMAWNAQAGQLKCEACGALAPAPGAAFGTGGRIIEYDLEAELAHPKPKGRIGSGARQTKCSECGAVVEFPDTLQATKCDFCGSPQVLAQEARADHYQPESLVPFAISRDQATQKFKTWQGKLWFRPNNLREKSSVQEFRGVYVPYWTFDCQITSHWTAEAGYYYTVTESYTTTENGQTVTKTRQVQKIRWEPASGQRHDAYDDHLICASKGVPDNLEHGISAFNTTGLVVYAPEYLQGFSAESYAVDLPDAWKKGQQELAAEQERRCEGDVPGDTHRNLSATHQFAAATFKHVLLPLWIAAYRYDGRVFRFLVNGQTGDVSGKAPYSVTKITLFVLMIAAIVAGIVFLVLRRGS